MLIFSECGISASLGVPPIAIGLTRRITETSGSRTTSRTRSSLRPTRGQAEADRILESHPGWFRCRCRACPNVRGVLPFPLELIDKASTEPGIVLVVFRGGAFGRRFSRTTRVSSWQSQVHVRLRHAFSGGRLLETIGGL